MTPRQTRAYFAQIPALYAAEQQRWLVVMTAATSQNPDTVRKLSEDLMTIQEGKQRETSGGGLITTDPRLIRAFLDGRMV